MNLLFTSRFLFKFTILFGKLLWIRYEITMKRFWNHFLFRDFTRNSSYFSRIHYQFREFTLNPRFTLNSLSASRFHYEFTIFSRIHLESIFSLWIYYLLRDFKMNLLYISGIHFEYTICFAYFLWIHHLTINLLSFSRNHCVFTIFFENSLLIKYLFREISLNSLFVSVIHY